MIQPSALNVLIIGASVVIFAFLWRMAAAKLLASDNATTDAIGQAMAVAL